jgi:hypothetical protein
MTGEGMVSRDVIDWYSWIWTTHRNEYFLVGSEESHCAIGYIKENTSGGLIIENDEVYLAVIERMQQEGIPVITTQEFLRLNELRRERFIEKQKMEKEKRKHQPQNRRALLYIVITLLGCTICFGLFVFFIYSDGCTWNKWEEPQILVPSSSALISERRLGNSYAQNLHHDYEDSALDEENLKAFFEAQGLHCSYDSSCSGYRDFWGTDVRYHAVFQSMDSQPSITTYWVEASWATCPARWED